MSGAKRQRPIPVTSAEREKLERYKTIYQDSTGTSGADWGNFLGTIALLGLGAAGIYVLSKVLSRDNSTTTVSCGSCRQNFLMAVPEGVGQAVHVKCPHCHTDLVVALMN